MSPVYKRFNGKRVKHGSKEYERATWYISKRIRGRLIHEALNGVRSEADALRFEQAIIDRETMSPLDFVRRHAMQMGEPPLSVDGFIYLIRAVGTMRYKIGYSTKPSQRIRALQTHSPVPLEIVDTMPGNKSVEAYLHAKFHECRVKGEWFEIADETRIRRMFELGNRERI
jgi:hypothetical protein